MSTYMFMSAHACGWMRTQALDPRETWHHLQPSTFYSRQLKVLLSDYINKTVCLEGTEPQTGPTLINMFVLNTLHQHDGKPF